MIYSGWFRNKMGKPIPGYEEFAPYDKGEGLYGKYSDGSVRLLYRGDTVPDKFFPYGSSVFESLTALFGKRVKILGSSLAYQQQGMLTDIFFPNVEVIKESAFQGCDKVSRVFIPKVKELGNSCLSGIKGFRSLSIPECTKIGWYTFTNTSIQGSSLFMPKVVIIPRFAFEHCASLGALALPSVRYIDREAFRHSGLTSIEIKAVGTLEEQVFFKCTKLTRIDISTATSIGDECFLGCAALKHIRCKRGMKSRVLDVLSSSSIPYTSVTIVEV